MSQREYAEEVVFFSLKSPNQFAARRRTVIVFAYNSTSKTIERRDFVGIFQGELENASEYIKSKNPQRICLNVDDSFAFSDGLRVGENKLVLKELVKNNLSQRVAFEPLLALNFIAARTYIDKTQLALFKDVMAVVWSIMRDMFSNKVIRPGVTTTQDLAWYYRVRVQALGFSMVSNFCCI